MDQIQLYSIAGYFYDLSLTMRLGEKELRKFGFGGYFKYDKNKEILSNGSLVDICGPSAIEGIMNNEKLEFEKNYYKKERIVNYKFNNVNGIWLGEWELKFRGEIIKGEAMASTNLIIENKVDEIICHANAPHYELF